MILSADELERLRLAYAGSDAAELRQLVEWTERLRLSEGMLNAALGGAFSISMLNGEPQFKLTKDGEKRVEDLMEPSNVVELSVGEIARLRRWREYAIDRLGLGPQTVEEIDRESLRPRRR